MLNFKIPLLSLGSLGRKEPSPEPAKTPDEDSSAPDEQQRGPDPPRGDSPEYISEEDDVKDVSSSKASSPASRERFRQTSEMLGPPISLLQEKKPPPFSSQPGVREFQRSTAQKARLETGDTVTFHSKDQIYKVEQETGADKPHYHLKLVEDADDDDSTTHLEIVCQGEFVGFRSAIAEDRYLQARKKGGPLAFFNTNLGVWEQWEVVGGQPESKWQTSELSFRSRQLPQVVLSVSVTRVGFYTSQSAVTHRPPDASAVITARPTHDDRISSISQWAVEEFVNFFQKEKEAMGLIEKRLFKAKEEARDAREWAVLQVNDMKRDMEENYLELEERLTVTEAELVKAWLARQRSVKFAVEALQRKRDAVVAQQVLFAWRIATAGKKETRLAVSRQLQRHRMRLLPQLFGAWQLHARRQALLRQRLHCFVDHSVSRKLHAAVTAWARHTEHLKNAHALANKEFGRRQVRQLRAGFEALREEVQRTVIKTDVARCLADSHQQTIRLHVWEAWKQGVAESRANDAAASATARSRRAQLLRQIFGYWSARSKNRKEHAVMLCRLQAKHKQRLAAAAFQCWAFRTETMAGARSAADQKAKRFADQTASAVLTAWQEHTAAAEDAARHHTSVLAARRSSGVCTRAVAAWAGIVDSKRSAKFEVERFAARQSRKLLAGCLASLKTAVDASKEAAREAEKRAAFLERKTLRHAVEVWRGDVWASLEAEAAAEIRARELQNKLLADVLHQWQLRARGKKELGKIEKTISSRHLKSTAQSAFGSWYLGTIIEKHEREERQAAERTAAEAEFAKTLKVERLVRKRKLGLILKAFSAWALVAAEHIENQNEAFIKLAAVKKTQEKRLASTSLMAWLEFAGHKIACRKEDRLLANLLAKRQTRRVLGAWGDLTLMLGIERRRLRAAEHKIRSRSSKASLSRAFEAWKEVVTSRRAAAEKLSAVAISERFYVQEPLQAVLMQRSARFCRADPARAYQIAAFAGWVVHTQERHQLRMRLVIGVERLAALKMGTVFDAWRDRVRAQKTQGRAVADLQKRQSVSVLQTAFDQWLGVVEEKKHTTAQLERCISAKKQAMQQFDYWYWQQVQSETKATLSTLFHSQTEDLEIVVAPTPENPIRTLPRTSMDQNDGERISAYLGNGRGAQRRTVAPVPGRSSRLSKSVAFDGSERRAGSSLAPISGSLSARGPRTDVLYQGLRLPSGSMTERSERTPLRQVRPQAGGLAARAAAISQEIEADIAVLQPRVSSAFKRLAGHDTGFLRALAEPLPEESSVEESDSESLSDSSIVSDTGSSAESLSTPPGGKGSVSSGDDSTTKPASTTSASRSLTSFDKSPSNFSPLAAGFYGITQDFAATPSPQVHYYDQREVESSELKSHKLRDDSEEDAVSVEEDAASFVTAWGPNTPANLADMTPGFWLNAGKSRGPTAAPTPPPFHTGLLQRLAEARNEPVSTPPTNAGLKAEGEVGDESK